MPKLGSVNSDTSKEEVLSLDEQMHGSARNLIKPMRKFSKKSSVFGKMKVMLRGSKKRFIERIEDKIESNFA